MEKIKVGKKRRIANRLKKSSGRLFNIETNVWDYIDRASKRVAREAKRLLEIYVNRHLKEIGIKGGVKK